MVAKTPKEKEQDLHFAMLAASNQTIQWTAVNKNSFKLGWTIW